MTDGMEHLPTARAAVTALRALAERYAREILVIVLTPWLSARVR